MATYNKEDIIRYIEDDLEPDTRLRFEEEMRKDPALAAEVALLREVKTTLGDRLQEDPREKKLRDTLKSLNEHYFGGSTTPVIASAASSSSPPGGSSPATIRWFSGIAIAASVIGIILLLWPSGRTTYLNNLGRTTMIDNTERGTNADSLLQQAAACFNRQEFDKAIPFLDQAVGKDSSNQRALFYRGVAIWHTGTPETARKDLEKVYNDGSLLQYEAAFYIALSYAMQHDDSTAKKWLARIPADAPVSEKAKNLEKKLH